MPQVSLAALPPDALFRERYRVVRCVKAGGMGVVYEVVDARTNTRRALKLMLDGIATDPDNRARFAREATITGEIESDHIVRVTDAGVDEATGTPFLVMEFLRGEDLAQRIAAHGPIHRARVVALLWQAALALDKTHAAGIIHRDLKPENLFVTRRDDGSLCLKILDFGIAKLMTAEQAQKTRALGTPLYMAPEQIRGTSRAIGPHTDVYALGHIAYAALSGEAYWSEEVSTSESVLPMLAIVSAGASDPPVARAERRRAIALPEGFDAWFARATAPRAEDRFQRATTAITALAEALGVDAPEPTSVFVRTAAEQEEPTRKQSTLSASEIAALDTARMNTSLDGTSTRRARSLLRAAMILVILVIGTLAVLATRRRPEDGAGFAASAPSPAALPPALVVAPAATAAVSAAPSPLPVAAPLPVAEPLPAAPLPAVPALEVPLPPPPPAAPSISSAAAPPKITPPKKPAAKEKTREPSGIF
jgi:serine/threonine-protein kinase